MSRVLWVLFWGLCWVGLLSAVAFMAGESVLWAAILGPPALFGAAVAWEDWPIGMAPGLARGVLVAVTLTAAWLGLGAALAYIVAGLAYIVAG